MPITPIAVLGPYRGGTSAVAGTLRQLGCYGGEMFFEAFTGYPTHESVYLRQCCLQCFDEDEGCWRYIGTFEQRVEILRRWIIWAARRAEAREFRAIVAKHPTLCMLVREIRIAWKLPALSPLIYVRVVRPAEDVLKSWETALASDGSKWWPRRDKAFVIHDLIESRDRELKNCPSIAVDFCQLRLSPQMLSDTLSKECGLPHRQHVPIKTAADIVAGEKERLLADINTLRVIRQAPQDAVTAPLVAMVVFNEERRLPDTLRHYRELGVERFAIIDNNSSDNTFAFLHQQPDVDLYSTDMHYRDSAGGSGWISALVHRYYGANRWVLWSDADEQFVYDRCEIKSLPDLCALLDLRKQESVPALMVEMYSKKSIQETSMLMEQTLLDCCNFFDARGYRRTVTAARENTGSRVNEHCVRWSGGPGERVFGVERGWQAKVPLIFWRTETWYWNPHVAYPFYLNLSIPTGALLHFKYLSDFASQVSREITRNEHAFNAQKYRQYGEHLTRTSELTLWSEMSVEYKSSRSLLNTDMMTSVGWDQ